jgi:hypothetical protein
LICSAGFISLNCRLLSATIHHVDYPQLGPTWGLPDCVANGAGWHRFPRSWRLNTGTRGCRRGIAEGKHSENDSIIDKILI